MTVYQQEGYQQHATKYKRQAAPRTQIRQAASGRALDTFIRFPRDTSFGQGLPEYKWLLTIEEVDQDHSCVPPGVTKLLNGAWILPRFLAMCFI